MVGAMLEHSVVMETSLRQDECVARLTSNLKTVPGYATWWVWPRDKALWGSVSAGDFRVQLGRARQLTFAQGRLIEGPNGTRIVTALGFKLWVVLVAVFSAVALVGVGFVIAETFGDNSVVAAVVVVGAVGLGTNFALGLLQQRDLIQAIARILDARRVPE